MPPIRATTSDVPPNPPARFRPVAVRIDPDLGDALARGATLPFDWYTNAEVLRLEQERIFRRAWQYVGHAGQLAEPGSFFTATAGLIPVVVTRTREDELKAFVNVCRHRGFQVAQGEGKRETLQCAYHAWTYGLDGTLRAAPRADREPDFDPAELSLLPVQVDTWGPFVFVNPDVSAPPLAEALGRLPELLAEVVDVEALTFHHRASSELETNWKVACENFLECYHCATAHPSFSKVVDVSPDSYRLEAEGLFSSQFGPVRATAAPSYSSGEVARSQFHFLWPNVGINVFPGRTNLSIGPSTRWELSGRLDSSTTSSAPASTRPGSRSCWSSTRRWAGRTRRSSRASSAACARARSTTATSWSRASR